MARETLFKYVICCPCACIPGFADGAREILYESLLKWGKVGMKKVRFFASLACCVLLAGCAAPLIFFGAGTAAGVAGFRYYDGALVVTYKSPYIDTWEATNKAFRDLRLTVESAKHDLTEGKVVGKRADGERVVAALKYVSGNDTEAQIRVGTLGDKQASGTIAEQIRRNLLRK
jgi:Protein of unknown function (DUF3568)